LPVPVREAVENFLEAWSHRDISDEIHLDYSETLREEAARFIGAQPDEICFTANTSAGMLLAASEVDFRPGDNLLIPAREFPANVIPWLRLDRAGVCVRFVGAADAAVAADDLMEAADGRTRAMAVSHVSFVTGRRIDLEKLGTFCRERNILLFVDAMQSAGAVRIDVRAQPVDMLAFASMKWLCAPPGCGIFFIRRGILEKLKGFAVGWRGMDWDGVGNLTDYGVPIFSGARRYDGGSPNVLGHVGLHASLRLFHDIGKEKIFGRISELTAHLIRGLESLGQEVTTPSEAPGRAGIVSFSAARADDLVETLKKRGIVISSRSRLARVSPHFYNTFEEIDRLLEILGSLT
jgi:selenocysteine lyase/cysteine desulfurase